jgi:threonine aldolase
MIDLRSDTVTQPTPEMRQAMAEAEVGDDVFSEDPTVNRLQEMAAERMGKDAALFVASGTMGNLAAVLAHCGRGDEVILGNQSHTFLFEAGGISALGGVQPYTLPNLPDGTLEKSAIKNAIRSENIHHPISRLVILENTHNRCGGVALTREYTQEIGNLAHTSGLKLHIDGARIFNAAVANKIDAKQLAEPADSVTFCLSKGLCAPVGSLLCGNKDFIYQARRIRKQLGGGMRQAGILAAAGIVALEKMIDRLEEDHERAKKLAEGLQNIEGIELFLGMPQTNMVFISLSEKVKSDAIQLSALLLSQGIKVNPSGNRSMRLVTHYWINDADVEKVIAGFRQVIM